MSAAQTEISRPRAVLKRTSWEKQGVLREEFEVEARVHRTSPKGVADLRAVTGTRRQSEPISTGLCWMNQRCVRCQVVHGTVLRHIKIGHCRDLWKLRLVT